MFWAYWTRRWMNMVDWLNDFVWRCIFSNFKQWWYQPICNFFLRDVNHFCVTRPGLSILWDIIYERCRMELTFYRTYYNITLSHWQPLCSHAFYSKSNRCFSLTRKNPSRNSSQKTCHSLIKSLEFKNLVTRFSSAVSLSQDSPEYWKLQRTS